MRHYLIRAVFSFAILGAGALGFSSDATADTKIFVGTMCVEVNDTTPEIMYNGFWASNTAGGNNHWTCPVIRDVTNGNITDWRVRYNRDGNTTDTWVIYLKSCDKSGTTCESDSETIPLTDGTLEANGEQVDTFEANGGVTIESEVPPDCRIYSYSIEE